MQADADHRAELAAIPVENDLVGSLDAGRVPEDPIHLEGLHDHAAEVLPVPHADCDSLRLALLGKRDPEICESDTMPSRVDQREQHTCRKRRDLGCKLEWHKPKQR